MGDYVRVTSQIYIYIYICIYIYIVLTKSTQVLLVAQLKPSFNVFVERQIANADFDKSDVSSADENSFFNRNMATWTRSATKALGQIYGPQVMTTYLC